MTTYPCIGDMHRYYNKTIVFRTVPQGVLSQLARRTNVAFEIDGLDERARTGWSVAVRGPPSGSCRTSISSSSGPRQDLCPGRPGTVHCTSPSALEQSQDGRSWPAELWRFPVLAWITTEYAVRQPAARLRK